MIDTRVIHALQVERLRKADMPADVQEVRTVFQTSTLDALMDGAYDGDVTFAELAQRGDFGLGTLDGLDGEMIALDGEFHQAGVDGSVRRIGAQERTPFAVVTRFRPDARASIDSPCDHRAMLGRLDALVADAKVCHAVRIDGRFESVRARSVPRQHPPYRPLAAVVATQVEFELTAVCGSIVGFRFPDYTQGLNVPGYHLHFVSDDRSCGGHVLDCHALSGEIRMERSADLHLELPAGIAWTEPGTSARGRGAIAAVEGGDVGAGTQSSD